LSRVPHWKKVSIKVSILSLRVIITFNSQNETTRTWLSLLRTESSSRYIAWSRRSG
jgi:hypothetical protein